LLTLLVVLFLATGGTGLWIFFGPNTFDNPPRRVFLVSRGQTFRAIVDSLSEQGIIRSRLFFDIVARTYGDVSTLRVGRYAFRSGISNAELFLTLRSGKENLLINVTVPEGSLSRTQARLFARALGVDSVLYMALVHDSAFAQSLGVESPSLEGYLLPQTYGFNWQQDEVDVVRAEVAELQLFFSDSLKNRARALGMTMHQVLTLASIVEGEAILDEERPTIAGVYHNRLRRRMRLEADPTIQFAIPDGPRRILYSDLRINSPYNTYKYAGLPPGPVGNPGTASILATLYPASHSYLFFVANGRGGHWFSTSYSQHMQNVRRFRRERAKGFPSG